MRRVSRHVPRDIQFKVLRRDNQICQICKKNVLYEDIEFDHIIPYAKGGPTAEHNIRLLCKACNKKKKDDYEDAFLVDNFHELMSDPMPISFLGALLDAVRFFLDFENENGRQPAIEDYNTVFIDKDGEIIGDIVKGTVDKIVSLLAQQNHELFEECYNPLQFRWGFSYGQIHKIKDTIQKYGCEERKLFEKEIELVNHCGWYMEQNKQNYDRWKLK